MAGYDIHFQPVPEAAVRNARPFEFGFKAALKVRGIQALINRWVKTFMTPKGSDPLYPEYGTIFGSLVGANIGDDFETIQDVVSLAISDANTQVSEQDVEGDFGDDEILENASLFRLVTAATNDGIEVWVLIENRSGEQLSVLLTELSTR